MLYIIFIFYIYILRFFRHRIAINVTVLRCYAVTVLLLRCYGVACEWR